MVGDKTGTGPNGAANDVAVVYPRGLMPFTIAVFYTGANGTSEGRNAVIAETARLAAEVLVKHAPKFQMQSHQVITRRVK